jgi:hypothetical protein
MICLIVEATFMKNKKYINIKTKQNYAQLQQLTYKKIQRLRKFSNKKTGPYSMGYPRG